MFTQEKAAFYHECVYETNTDWTFKFISIKFTSNKLGEIGNGSDVEFGWPMKRGANCKHKLSDDDVPVSLCSSVSTNLNRDRCYYVCQILPRKCWYHPCLVGLLSRFYSAPSREKFFRAILTVAPHFQSTNQHSPLLGWRYLYSFYKQHINNR